MAVAMVCVSHVGLPCVPAEMLRLLDLAERAHKQTHCSGFGFSYHSPLRIFWKIAKVPTGKTCESIPT